ncbi:MAG: NAD/NADP octopine/nopaline dehydrogenase, partial [Alphaproteobacteria bacterium]
GLTDGVARIMTDLDKERLAVATAFGHALPDLFHEMQAIGTIEAQADPAQGLAAAIRGGKANARIKAPDSLAHRYYREDFWYGLMPFLALAQIAGVAAPTAAALFHLGAGLAGADKPKSGRDAAAMGIAGLGKAQLIAKVKPS